MSHDIDKKRDVGPGNSITAFQGGNQCPGTVAVGGRQARNENMSIKNSNYVPELEMFSHLHLFKAL